MGSISIIPLSIILILKIFEGSIYNIFLKTSISQDIRDYVDTSVVINDIIEKLDLNISNPSTRYSLYYSGRVLEFIRNSCTRGFKALSQRI